MHDKFSNNAQESSAEPERTNFEPNLTKIIKKIELKLEHVRVQPITNLRCIAPQRISNFAFEQ